MERDQKETSQKAAHSFCCLILYSLDHQTYSVTNKQVRRIKIRISRVQRRHLAATLQLQLLKLHL